MMHPPSDPSRRVAVLTGATGRLGREITAVLEGRGYHVVSIVRSVEPALVGTGTTYPCDVTDEESVVSVFEHVRTVHGHIDALIHTVGAWGLTPLLDTRLADWKALMDVNLTSAFLCFREGARAMSAGGGGGLVALASRQGAERAPAGQSAYAAAKAGVIRLAEATAAEFGDRGITARVVVPSTILFDGATGSGVAAEEVARLCVDLVDPAFPVVSGSSVPAYGTSVA